MCTKILSMEMTAYQCYLMSMLNILETNLII